eukprot:4915523-Pyramimonas_sp.AAC.1
MHPDKAIARTKDAQQRALAHELKSAMPQEALKHHACDPGAARKPSARGGQAGRPLGGGPHLASQA